MTRKGRSESIVGEPGLVDATPASGVTLGDVAPGFRMSELGSVPDDWDAVPVGKVATFINGFAFGPEHWGQRGRPIIRIQNLTGSSNKSNCYEGELDHKYLVTSGDLLVSWSASLNAFVWRGPDAWVNQHIFKVDDYRPTIVKAFMFHALRYRIDAFRGKTRGSTMRHVTRKEFLATQIPLPPLAEQRTIAAVLNRVQAAIDAADGIIAALCELKKSMMRHVFTFGPVSVGEADKVPLQEAATGPMPEHWQAHRLGSQVILINGRGFKSTEWCTKGLPIIRIENLKDLRAECNYFDGEFDDKIRIRAGDLLFSWSGSKGTSFGPHVWHGPDGLLNQHIFKVCVRFNASVTPAFLYQALLMLTAHIEEKTYGLAALVHVRKGDLEAISVPAPPALEQRSIESMLVATAERLDAERSRRSALQALFETLLRKLMTGEIRVNEWNLEEAA